MKKRQEKEILALVVNDEVYELAVEPQETLLEVLRDHLGLTGTKEGCGTGECGTCTVLMEGEPVLSCLTLAMDCREKRIQTIEGLDRGDGLTPVQDAFLHKGAVQCGFCTPGMILATTALLEENPHPSREEIKKGLEGHLCRCTGYNKIMEAMEEAVQIRAGHGDSGGVSNG
ncbi:MAG: (2Fe-2S)-binding protein [Deltaproteobacteria bacterium]|nr:(2Fe-2S)-binding protein [Deltaproteobacteria bacterium]HDZ89850.1 (2Fe-2S)-binding protein [Deltaproteobacteria bacterium]